MTDLNWGTILDEQAADPETGAAPDGDYEVRISGATVAVASTGNSMIKVVAEVTEGPYKGKPIWTNIVFKTDSPGAMKMAITRLQALGIDRNWLASANPKLETIANEIKNAEAIATVTSREWNGEKRNDIKMFKPLGSGSGVAPRPNVPSAPSVGPAPSVPSPPVPSPAPSPAAPPSPDVPPAPSVPSSAESEDPF